MPATPAKKAGAIFKIFINWYAMCLNRSGWALAINNPDSCIGAYLLKNQRCLWALLYQTLLDVQGSLRGCSFWLCKDLAPTQFFFFASHLRKIPGRFVRIYVIIINLAILKGNLEFIQLQFIPLIAIIHPTQNVPHEKNLPGVAIWIVLS